MAYNPFQVWGQNLAKQISTIGSLARIPNMGISGTIAYQDPTKVVQPGFRLQPMPAFSAYAAAPSTPTYDYSQARSVPMASYNPNPTVSGQGPGGGGGTGGGNPITLTSPVPDNTGMSDEEAAARIRPGYEQAARDIQARGGELDTSYGLAKGDITAAQEATQKAATTQKAENAATFGDILKSQLQNKQELDRQRMGTFAGLGTLESSAYGEQQFRGDQAYGEQRGRTLVEQEKRNQAIDDQVATYSKQATSDLAKLALSYQSGKNAIASALANNDLNRASAIQAAIDKVKARAIDIQNTMIDFANKAQMLKTMGYDVRTSIGGQGAGQYAGEVSNMLGNMTKAGNSLYTIPTTGDQGQGYIAPNGKRYTSRDEYLRLLNAGQQ